MWTYIVYLCALQSHLSEWPFGTYKAVVHIPFLPKQEIMITTRQRRKAEIILSGAINVKEPFSYDYIETQWDVQFGSKLLHVLKKCHCTLKNLDFDLDRNIASVSLTMPVVGSMRITLDNICT